jgi:hypothetical protein
MGWLRARIARRIVHDILTCVLRLATVVTVVSKPPPVLPLLGDDELHQIAASHGLRER